MWPNEKDDDLFVGEDWIDKIGNFITDFSDAAAVYSPLGSSPNLQGSSSNGQHSFTFEQNANAGPLGTSGESIPPWFMPVMPTIEIQNYDESSHYLSGYSNPNEPKTPAMHCGQKRTADNLEVGVSVLAQKYRRVDNISFPDHRRNSPRVFNQANHTESDLGNYPTTEIESCKVKAAYSMLSGLTPGALANTSQPLQNGIPCEDICETSTKRNCQEKETHFVEQPTEIQSNNLIRQAIGETIGDNDIPNAITDYDIVDAPTHMGVQPFLGSISTQPSNSSSSIECTKLHFKKLMASSLEVLSDPDKETSMNNVLAILANNLPSFSGKQGDQILELSLEFPSLVHNWRDWYSKSQRHSQQSSAATEKIRDLVENSGEDEESLRVRYEVLENKEKELMRQLDEVQKQKAEMAQQRTEKSKLTKDLKEKEVAHRNKEENLKRIASEKLNKLSAQWAERQSFFT